jgi:hypothetical protein
VTGGELQAAARIAPVDAEVDVGEVCEAHARQRVDRRRPDAPPGW